MKRFKASTEGLQPAVESLEKVGEATGVQLFEESDLLSFGQYLLSDERYLYHKKRQIVLHGITPQQAHDSLMLQLRSASKEDLKRWKEKKLEIV